MDTLNNQAVKTVIVIVHVPDDGAVRFFFFFFKDMFKVFVLSRDVLHVRFFLACEDYEKGFDK